MHLSKDQQEVVVNTPEQSANAQKNWALLRKHVAEMRTKANHLVVALAEAYEEKLENRYEAETNANVGGKYGEKNTGIVARGPRTCLQNIMIDPT